MASFPFPIILALLMNNIKNHGIKKFVQTVTYMPYFISTVVLVGMMQLFFSPYGGLFNTILSWFGGEGNTYFMGRPEYFRKWSLDACVGYARLHRLFPADEMVCTHTLYNEVWAGNLDLSVAELPEALKRKRHKDSKPREHKKHYGKDIDERPEIAALRIEEGHWEGDTVVGRKAGKQAVILSLLEKKTENYIALQIPGRDADSVLSAMQLFKEEFGNKFLQVFKTITVDNGPEFSGFAQVENWGSQVYFAHPYTSWERPQNERHNGLFRAFVPKGVSIGSFSPEYILSAADELNGRPRKKLGYHTPEELFERFLDSVYAASGCGSIVHDGSQRLPSCPTL